MSPGKEETRVCGYIYIYIYIYIYNRNIGKYEKNPRPDNYNNHDKGFNIYNKLWNFNKLKLRTAKNSSTVPYVIIYQPGRKTGKLLITFSANFIKFY